MAKAEKAAVPKMYPLQGDHKRPEVSQTGMIKTQAPNQQEVPEPVQAKPAIQELQLPQVVNPNPMVRNVNTVQTVNTNFPIINPAHTVYPNPIIIIIIIIIYLAPFGLTIVTFFFILRDY